MPSLPTVVVVEVEVGGPDSLPLTAVPYYSTVLYSTVQCRPCQWSPPIDEHANTKGVLEPLKLLLNTISPPRAHPPTNRTAKIRCNCTFQPPQCRPKVILLAADLTLSILACSELRSCASSTTSTILSRAAEAAAESTSSGERKLLPDRLLSPYSSCSRYLPPRTLFHFPCLKVLRKNRSFQIFFGFAICRGCFLASRRFPTSNCSTQLQHSTSRAPQLAYEGDYTHIHPDLDLPKGILCKGS